MRAFSHSVEGAALAIDRTICIALAKLAFGLAHGLAGITELAHFVALALLAMHPPDPGRYGRVIGDGAYVDLIVEWSDATEDERAVALVYLERWLNRR